MEESTRESPAATTSHRRRVSGVTTCSEREQQYEQERLAARRGGRRVSASELKGPGIEGGEEAQGTSEGRATSTRKIRAPSRALGEATQ